MTIDPPCNHRPNFQDSDGEYAPCVHCGNLVDLDNYDDDGSPLPKGETMLKTQEVPAILVALRNGERQLVALRLGYDTQDIHRSVVRGDGFTVTDYHGQPYTAGPGTVESLWTMTTFVEPTTDHE